MSTKTSMPRALLRYPKPGERTASLPLPLTGLQENYKSGQTHNLAKSTVTKYYKSKRNYFLEKRGKAMRLRTCTSCKNLCLLYNPPAF